MYDLLPGDYMYVDLMCARCNRTEKINVTQQLDSKKIPFPGSDAPPELVEYAAKAAGWKLVPQDEASLHMDLVCRECFERELLLLNIKSAPVSIWKVFAVYVAVVVFNGALWIWADVSVDVVVNQSFLGLMGGLVVSILFHVVNERR